MPVILLVGIGLVGWWNVMPHSFRGSIKEMIAAHRVPAVRDVAHVLTTTVDVSPAPTRVAAAPKKEGPDVGQLPSPEPVDVAELPRPKAPRHNSGVNPVTGRVYTLAFGGAATRDGKPCAHATVIVKASTPQQNSKQVVFTDAEGNYTVSMRLLALPNQAIDWSMEAFSPERERLEFTGRHIAMREDDPISVDSQLAFLSQTK